MISSLTAADGCQGTTTIGGLELLEDGPSGVIVCDGDGELVHLGACVHGGRLLFYKGCGPLVNCSSQNGYGPSESNNESNGYGSIIIIVVVVIIVHSLDA